MRRNGLTRIVGLIGYPVEHSKSPLMHNAAFRELGLDYTYLLFSVPPANLKDAIKGLRALNIAGVNVTIPHKEQVMQYLDTISSEARLIGAVNTIHNQNGKLVGYNTDGQGFINSLLIDGKIRIESQRGILIGAGGAGKAIAVKLAERGIQSLAITDKVSERANFLVERIHNNVPDCLVFSVPPEEKELARVISEATLLINATPVGMSPGDPCVVDPSLLHKNLFVYDVIYNRETPLVAEARRKGLRTLDGLGMLIYQGAISFEIWTGKKAPIEVMRSALLESDKVSKEK